MNPIEALIASLAPHVCFGCGSEGTPLCMPCLRVNAVLPSYRCYRCSARTNQSFVCPDCMQVGGISNLWVGATYAGFAKDLTKQLKFQRVKASATVMAHWLYLNLPPVAPGTVICPVPTASKRVRARGYDQASLIAKHLAKRRKLAYIQLLRRITSTRQVGANRHERFAQLSGAFTVHNLEKVKDYPILLIDDVLTTGSTLESAALTLRSNGVTNISAATFAYQAKVRAFPSSTKIDSG